MKVTILGSVCIDHNISENITYTSAGSPAMFISKIYKNFPNVSTTIISQYGKDFLQYLSETAVYPREATIPKTLIYQNKAQGNTRTQKALNTASVKPLPFDNNIHKILAETDILFFAPITPYYSPEYITEFINNTNNKALKILLPQGYYRSFDSNNNVVQRDFTEADIIVPLFDQVIVSEQDHQDIFAIAEHWSTTTGVILTLGDKGSQYVKKDEKISTSVNPVKEEDIIDSIGSGDIFSASFGYKYYLTQDIKQSMSFANNIARQCLFFHPDNLKITFPE
ncbi:PfkB family carbohydrate kinase [Patescibacteria group bacterium]